MRRSLGLGVCVCCILSAAAGAPRAEPKPAASAPRAELNPANRAAGAPERIAARSALTPAEQQSRVAGQLDEIKRLIAAIETHLQRARGRGDPLQINCVYDKLNQALGLQKTAQAARDSFALAAKAKNDADRAHYLGKAEYLREKIAELERESLLCLGDAAAVTSVEVIEVGGRLQDDSDDLQPVNDKPEIEVPEIPPASPYR